MIQRLQAKRNEEGFTLIELLIVIIVLGILAAIVVFAIGSTRSDAVQSSCKTSSKAVELAAEAINTKTGAYPALANSVAPVAPATNAMLSANGGLLKAWPSNSDYIIQWSGTAVQVFPKTYTVSATGVVMDNTSPNPQPATAAEAIQCTSL